MLSTYNGSRYLDDLLKSLANQTYKNFTIYIRDDGSQDSTPKIIEDFAKNRDNVVVFPKERNLGANASFLYMLSRIDSSYYMYCDQDDVWMESKIADTFDVMLKEERTAPDAPIIVHTDLLLCDSNLKQIDKSFWHSIGHNPHLPKSFNYYCHYVDVTGCTMMFNSKSKEVCKDIYSLDLPNFLYYDRLISLLVSRAKGIIVPICKPTVFYRRHEGTKTNPFGDNRSILKHPWHVFPYLKCISKEHDFYKSIGYDNFVKFLFYRYRLTRIRKKSEYNFQQ